MSSLVVSWMNSIRRTHSTNKLTNSAKLYLKSSSKSLMGPRVPPLHLKNRSEPPLTHFSRANRRCRWMFSEITWKQRLRRLQKMMKTHQLSLLKVGTVAETLKLSSDFVLSFDDESCEWTCLTTVIPSILLLTLAFKHALLSCSLNLPLCYSHYKPVV